MEAAEAAVKMAQLDVDYTTIKAPYNSMVTERNVSVGSLTNTQDNLMTLVGIDEYRIEAAVAIDKLTSLNLKKKCQFESADHHVHGSCAGGAHYPPCGES